MDSIMPTVNAKIWYSGKAHTLVGCSPAGTLAMAGSNQAAHCKVLATRLRLSSTAPLETPVVPPVYCNTATSSGWVLGGVKGTPAALANAALKGTASGRL